MYETLAVVLFNVTLVAVLSWRLHGIDPDLTAVQYFRRMMAAQFRLGTTLLETEEAAERLRKPNGRRLDPAFGRFVALAAGSSVAIILLAAAVSFARHGL
jgi:hypothetical protein